MSSSLVRALGALSLLAALATASPASAALSVDVTQLGARCDGVTDDTAAFQTARNKVNAAGGGTITLPANATCLIRADAAGIGTATALVGSNTTLRAATHGWSLFSVGNGSAGSSISGVTFDGASIVTRGLEVGRGATDFAMRGGGVTNVLQPTDSADPNYNQMPIGIRVEGDGARQTYDGVAISNVVGTHGTPGWAYPVARGMLLDNGGGAVGVSKNVTVQNSSFSEVAPKDDGDCLVIQGTGETNAGLQVLNNTFDRCHKRALKLQVGGVTVRGNTINNPFVGDNAYVARPTSDDLYGPDGKPAYGMFALVSIFQSNTVFAGNTLTGPGGAYEGVEVSAPSGGLTGLSITDNVLVNGSGFTYRGSSSLIRTFGTLTGATITGNRLGNAYVGIWLGQSFNGTLASNTISNVNVPIAQ